MNCERFAHWYLCRRGAYVRLAFEAIGTYFIKTVNGRLLRVHKIDACSKSREYFSNNLGSHAYAGATFGPFATASNPQGRCIAYHSCMYINTRLHMGISRYKVQGTRKLQATGDPSLKLALIASQPRSLEVVCRCCGSWEHIF